MKTADMVDSFSHETQIVLTEEAEKAFCFVHQFMLLDILARGYVRPLYFCFFTQDSKKNNEEFS